MNTRTSWIPINHHLSWSFPPVERLASIWQAVPHSCCFQPSFHWDQRHLELWYEAMAAANTLTKTKNDGHVTIVGLRTTCLRTALACPLVIAYSTLNHVTSEYPELQCAVILTMDIAQERHVLYNIFACHARAPLLNFLSGQNRQKTGQPEPVTLDPCHNNCWILSMTKCIVHLHFHPSILCADPCTTTFSTALSYLYPSTEARNQMHSQHTEISTDACMPSTWCSPTNTQSLHQS